MSSNQTRELQLNETTLLAMRQLLPTKQHAPQAQSNKSKKRHSCEAKHKQPSFPSQAALPAQALPDPLGCGHFASYTCRRPRRIVGGGSAFAPPIPRRGRRCKRAGPRPDVPTSSLYNRRGRRWAGPRPDVPTSSLYSRRGRRWTGPRPDVPTSRQPPGTALQTGRAMCRRPY